MKTDETTSTGEYSKKKILIYLHQLGQQYFFLTNFMRFSNMFVGYEEQVNLDDDDDVIVVPQEEPVITEIPDDDDEINDKVNDKEPSSPSVKKPLELLEEVTGGVYTSIANESDIQILEPAISFMDLDQIEDEPENSKTVGESSQISLPVKIKMEPKYDGYEQDEEDAFEVVGTFEDSAINLMDEASGKFYHTFF